MDDRLRTLFPVIVPRSYDEDGAWPGRLFALAHPGLAVTHVWLEADQTLLYVNAEEGDELAAAGIDWRQVAMDNLEASCQVAFHTHEKQVAGALEMVAFMNDDGLGTSRLLLTSRLAALFPEGYLVGIPERSCGIAISARLADAARRNYAELVRKCHAEGTVPMLDGLHTAGQFVIRP